MKKAEVLITIKFTARMLEWEIRNNSPVHSTFWMYEKQGEFSQRILGHNYELAFKTTEVVGIRLIKQLLAFKHIIHILPLMD